MTMVTEVTPPYGLPHLARNLIVAHKQEVVS